MRHTYIDYRMRKSAGVLEDLMNSAGFVACAIIGAGALTGTAMGAAIARGTAATPIDIDMAKKDYEARRLDADIASTNAKYKRERMGFKAGTAAPKAARII